MGEFWLFWHFQPDHQNLIYQIFKALQHLHIHGKRQWPSKDSDHQKTVTIRQNVFHLIFGKLVSVKISCRQNFVLCGSPSYIIWRRSLDGYHIKHSSVTLVVNFVSLSFTYKRVFANTMKLIFIISKHCFKSCFLNPYSFLSIHNFYFLCGQLIFCFYYNRNKMSMAT